MSFATNASPDGQLLCSEEPPFPLVIEQQQLLLTSLATAPIEEVEPDSKPRAREEGRNNNRAPSLFFFHSLLNFQKFTNVTKSFMQLFVVDEL